MLILIGASASGKTEIAKLLAKKYNIAKVVTYTTRKKRAKEVKGIDYNFVSLEEFAQLIDENFFIEYTYYNNCYYGTAKNDICDNRCIILDPNGFKKFKTLNIKNIISFYLSCDEETRYGRMLTRGDDVVAAKKRIINDKIAFNDNYLQGVTFVVNSDNITLNALCDKIYNLYVSTLVE